MHTKHSAEGKKKEGSGVLKIPLKHPQHKHNEMQSNNA